MAKNKIGILSLGCARNLVDTETILGRLNRRGYSLVEMEKADVGIVNTCAFIEDAKKESVEAVLDLIELKKEGKLKKIIVYGCLSQRYGRQLIRQLPEVDAFVGRASLNHEARRLRLTPPHYAYLKICEGCINRCSFCAIPQIKGKFSSLDEGSLLRKVEDFDRQKIAELNLIGQDITGYGLDLYGKIELPRLLKKIIRSSSHIPWLRLLYLYPSRISDELLELIKSEPRICKYIDVPLQHISGRILKLMRRRSAEKDIRALIEKIRKTIPGVAVRSSLIVGFPSETERDFRKLLKFIADVQFERLGAFIYSREEGTRAYNLKPQVPEKIKRERLGALMSLQQRISAQINRKFLGKTLDILIEEKQKGSYLGRSQFDAPEVDGLVYVRSAESLDAGSFKKVKIVDTLEYDLVGEVIR
jgi:ribosomal protein S12 methylthiotransferase